MSRRVSVNDSRNETAVPSLQKVLLGVMAGGGVLLALMLLLAGMAMGFGWIIPASSGRLDLTPWLVLEVVGGALASVLGGAISRRVAGHARGPLLLAAGVFTLGLLEATELLRYVRARWLDAPQGLVLLAPLVTAAGVLLGGMRPGTIRFRPAGPPLLSSFLERLRYAAPLLVLATAAALSLLVLPGLSADSEPHLMAAALSLDFTVVMPGLVYAGLVRTRRLPWIALLPAFVVGYALAVTTIPSQHHTVLDVLRLLLIPAELAVVGYLLLLMRKTWTQVSDSNEGDFATRFRSAAGTVLASRIPADILATEVSLFYYALGRNRAKPLPSGSYTVHREAGYLPILLGMAMVLLVETVALHFLVSQWSGLAAWVLTGLSVYAGLWLAGDYRAMAARPIRLTATHLLLRIGLRWEAALPLSLIDAVALLKGPPAQPARDVLVAVVLGQPNLRLQLRTPVEVTGMYGLRRTVREIWLRVDGAPKLYAALHNAASL